MEQLFELFYNCQKAIIKSELRERGGLLFRKPNAQIAIQIPIDSNLKIEGNLIWTR